MKRATSQVLRHGLPSSFFNTLPRRSHWYPGSHPLLRSSRWYTNDHTFDTRAKLREIAAQVAAKYGLNPDKPFQGCMVVGIQHMLSTTVDMFAVMRELGLEYAIIGGKHYSTNEECVAEFEALGSGFKFIESSGQWGYGVFDRTITQTADQAWVEVIAQLKQHPTQILLAMDDGADLLLGARPELFSDVSYKPRCVMGIEQTRGGSNQELFSGLPFPVINVAGSFAKSEIEYPRVAEIVAQKVLAEVEKYKDSFGTLVKVGIVGYGTMGQAVAKACVSIGYPVLAYDQKGDTGLSDHKITFYQNIGALCSHADIIIGCTGNDITDNPMVLELIEKSSHHKILMSTSSKDVEFNRLLRRIQIKRACLVTDPKSDITFETNAGGRILICRGGFPINFDNARHSVAPEHIWPTRALLLASAMMGVRLCKTNQVNYKRFSMLQLDAYAQQLILQGYQQETPEFKLDESEIWDIKKIENQSEGTKLDL